MNRKFFIVVSTLLMTSCGILFAADGVSAYAAAQAKVKAKFPKEFAEVEKLAATDMRAAMRKLTELASRAKVDMPGSTRSKGRTSRRGTSGFRRGGREQMRGGREQMRGGREQMRGGSRFGRGGEGFGVMNIFGRVNAESAIAEKMPAEFAAAVKQMNDAERAMSALAEKAGVKLPVAFDAQIRMLQEKDPAAMDAVRKAMGNDPRNAMAALRALAEKHGVKLMEQRSSRGKAPASGGSGEEPGRIAPPVGREISIPSFSKLRAAFPEEMARYNRLRREDPRAARELLKRLSDRLAEKEKAAGDKK